MNTDQKLQISTNESAATTALGERIGRALQPGQLVECVGDLGGGKTTLIRGIARGLGIHQHITSPTFNLQRSYSLPAGGTLEHFDLYRLDDGDVVEAELAEFLADPTCIVVVEWADRFAGRLSSDRLIVELRYVEGDKRNITIAGTGSMSTQIVETLR